MTVLFVFLGFVPGQEFQLCISADQHPTGCGARSDLIVRYDADEPAELPDWSSFAFCMEQQSSGCATWDFDGDYDVDLVDVAAYQRMQSHLIFPDAGERLVYIHSPPEGEADGARFGGWGPVIGYAVYSVDEADRLRIRVPDSLIPGAHSARLETYAEGKLQGRQDRAADR